MPTPLADASAEETGAFVKMKEWLPVLGLHYWVVLSRPDDPLPRALAQLPGLDVEGMRLLAQATDAGTFDALLATEPTTFANYLLLCRLVNASALGPGIAAKLVPDASEGKGTLAERRADMQVLVGKFTAAYSIAAERALVQGYDADEQTDMQHERAAFVRILEHLFEEWNHSLGADLMPAPEPVLAIEGPGWNMTPIEAQLDFFRTTSTWFGRLPRMSSHPFAQAVAHLPEFHPQRIEELTDFLEAALPDEPLALNRAQGMLLYVAAHVVILCFINDLYDVGSLDDVVVQSIGQYDHIEEVTPEEVSIWRRNTILVLGRYVTLLRENAGHTADFQALEARLAPVLALAVS